MKTTDFLHENRNFLRHEACENCGSSDGVGVYDNGFAFCYVCNTPREGTGGGKANAPRTFKGFLSGHPSSLPKRSITENTCQKWGYVVTKKNGKPCQVANYRDLDGRQVVAQKVRYPDKSFIWAGDPKSAGLYGEHLWSGGKMVVVTEGEIDALSVSQAQDNRWPVVSVPNGSSAAKRDISRRLEFFERFERVVLMFDSDEPGREAALECAPLFAPGKVRIATLPLKDPNEMLVAGRSKELVSAIWQAKEWRPDGLISIDDVIEQAKKPPEWGRSWCWETLTELTYGIRPGELYALGAGVGAGKTDVFTQWISHDIQTHTEEPVGVIYLEQSPIITAQRLAGKIAGKPFHVPDGPWTQEELNEAMEQLRGRVVLYDHRGAPIEWSTIKSFIRYMATGYGVKHVYLDHLTALVAHAEDERRELDSIMADMSGLCQNLGLSIFFVSHLATPTGTPHEEGGRISSRHLRGSRAIMQWANFIFGLERDQQAKTAADRHTALFRVLKDRNTGRGNGCTFALRYDPKTGLLSEAGEAYEDFFHEQQPRQTNSDF